MLKKWFDWTPRDIAQWEAIRQKGLGRFIAWYGLLISGGLFFIVPGAAILFTWVKSLLSDRPGSIAYLGLRLLVTAVLCLFAGFINSLVTWLVEEKLYQKYARQGQDVANLPDNLG